MSKTQEMFEALTGTAEINPDAYSYRTSPNRFSSLSFALAGWLYMLRRQKNTRIQAVASAAVFGLALWLQIGLVEWAVLILTITIVWMAEFLNAAVEAAINLSTTDYHPMAKVGKDVASAAVLLGAVSSLLIGALTLGPPLLHRIGLM
ncbi:MAG: diacylglycerol kinase family protein [Chloroflexi bacterium]|nr:diacylglycerol kinase family protein [Chloroflexota bacterium]